MGIYRVTNSQKVSRLNSPAERARRNHPHPHPHRLTAGINSPVERARRNHPHPHPHRRHRHATTRIRVMCRT